MPFPAVLAPEPNHGHSWRVEAVLAALARVCRDRERLRFDYRDHDGGESVRLVEPYRLVHARRRWYLVVDEVGERSAAAEGRVRDDILFLAGECAGLLFFRGFAGDAGEGG